MNVFAMIMASERGTEPHSTDSISLAISLAIRTVS